MKVLITTVPFGDKNRLPLDLLKKSNIEYIINPLNKKLNEEELIKMIVDFDAIIAGTEKISEKVLNKANKLKHISKLNREEKFSYIYNNNIWGGDKNFNSGSGSHNPNIINPYIKVIKEFLKKQMLKFSMLSVEAYLYKILG